MYSPPPLYTALTVLLVVLLTTSITSIILLRRKIRQADPDYEKDGYEASGKTNEARRSSSIPELRITFPEDEDRAVKSVVVRISQAGCAFVTPVVETVVTQNNDENEKETAAIKSVIDVNHVVHTVPMPY